MLPVQFSATSQGPVAGLHTTELELYVVAGQEVNDPSQYLDLGQKKIVKLKITTRNGYEGSAQIPGAAKHKVIAGCTASTGQLAFVPKANLRK